MKLYCFAPFSSPSITPDGFKICSAPRQKTFKSIDFWNEKHIKRIRKQWMNDEIPDECRECFNANSPTILTSSKSGMSEEVLLNFEDLYIARSNKCDYACEMCSATISHTYDKVYNNANIGIIENNFDLTPYLKDTKRIAISGGNPVLDFKLIDIINQLNSKKIERFLITTNGSVFPDKFLNAIIEKQFKCDVELIFSIDGDKKFNEKVRSGAKQEKIYNTISKVYKKIKQFDNIYVSIEFTATNKSIYHLIALYKEIQHNLFVDGDRRAQSRLGIIGNVCNYPENLALQNADKEAKDYMINHLMPFFLKRKEECQLARLFYRITYKYHDVMKRAK